MKQNITSVLAALEEEVTPDGSILLARLKDLLDPDEHWWPEQTFAEALRAFGNPIYSASAIRKSLDTRIYHTLNVWTKKYGPLNAEQELYADQVLARCIAGGIEDAAGDRIKRRTFVLNNLSKAANHEVVDAGFKARADKTENLAPEIARILNG